MDFQIAACHLEKLSFEEPLYSLTTSNPCHIGIIPPPSSPIEMDTKGNDKDNYGSFTEVLNKLTKIKKKD
jgi:hypothetical protein